MFCHKCGTQNDDGAKFCGSCGTPLGEQFAAAQAPVPDAAPVGAQPAAQAPVNAENGTVTINVGEMQQQARGFLKGLPRRIDVGGHSVSLVDVQRACATLLVLMLLVPVIKFAPPTSSTSIAAAFGMSVAVPLSLGTYIVSLGNLFSTFMPGKVPGIELPVIFLVLPIALMAVCRFVAMIRVRAILGVVASLAVLVGLILLGNTLGDPQLVTALQTDLGFYLYGLLALVCLGASVCLLGADAQATEKDI